MLPPGAKTMLQRLRSRRAQAVIETALILPFLTMLTLGSADLGRAFYLSLEITGAARAGMRGGIQGTGNDIGDATRSEPNTAIPDTAAAWGATGPGGNNDCDPGQPGHTCGNSLGCPPSAFAAGQMACFAVRSCTLDANGVCASYSAWQTRPAGGAAQPASLVVRVVYKFTPVTPFISNFSTGGSFYLIRETVGLELY